MDSNPLCIFKCGLSVAHFRLKESFGSAYPRPASLTAFTKQLTNAACSRFRRRVATTRLASSCGQSWTKALHDRAQPGALPLCPQGLFSLAERLFEGGFHPDYSCQSVCVAAPVEEVEEAQIHVRCSCANPDSTNRHRMSLAYKALFNVH